MYLDIFNKTVADLKDVMNVPDGYKIMFVQGGATQMFASVAMNLMDGGKADYIDSGNFAHNALVEAKKYGEVVVAGSSREDNYTYIPKYTLSPDAKYVHITTNNTIYGTRFDHVPETGNVPLVADMSSNILSEVYDVSKFGVIYAGAQKNVAPAGLTIVIVREDLLGDVLDCTPEMLNWKVMADNNSMYNTPPCYSIYMAKLVMEWVSELGGLEKMKEMNEKKAKLLYDYLDSQDYYIAPVKKECRSMMNVTFVTGNADLDKKFASEASASGLKNLKGHRSVGGMRASIYNAMPYEGVEKLVAFMRKFALENPKF
jgi:phosphoserine aminotransferase